MKKLSNMPAVAVSCLLAVGVLSGCNTSSKSTDAQTTTTVVSGLGAEEQAGTEGGESIEQSQTYAKVVERPGEVQKRGGYIRILVDNIPITNLDINHRMKFLQLRRVSGDRRKLAENELIDQAIKVAEAKRRRTLAADKAVENAFENFSRQNRVSKSQLTSELGRMGIGAPHFKEYIRSEISWQTTVQRKFQADTTNKSEVDVITGLRKSGGEKPELAEYHFQQVVFVIPSDKRKALLPTRKKEAIAFRQRFSGCGQTVDAAKALRDVTVKEHRRIMEPELPEAWRNEISGLNAGGTTDVKETQNGLEFIAVCDRKMVSDDRAAQVASQAADFGSFGAQGGKLAQDYLSELRSKASIVYR